MFCRWRATVCSLTTSSCRDLPVAPPGGDESQHLELTPGEAVELASLAGLDEQPRRERHPVAAPRLLEPGGRSLELEQCPCRRRRAHDRRARRSTCVCAQPRTGRRAPARRATHGAGSARAPRASPAASSIIPRDVLDDTRGACALSQRPQISASSAQASRAPRTSSPTASRISIDAGSRQGAPERLGGLGEGATDRGGGGLRLLLARGAGAPRPGCGSRPQCVSRRGTRLPPRRSRHCRRCISPCRYRAPGPPLPSSCARSPRSRPRRASSSASVHAPSQLHDLRAVDAAAAAECDELGLLVAPA